MAGGVGARFWPLSRNARPKQFIDILGVGETFIQQTFRRMTSVCPPENIFVVTHQNYKNLVLEQLPAINPEHVLCEPMRRNTAPCIAYAVYKINKLNPDANIIVAPSDHVIIKENNFTQTLQTALSAAEKNNCLLTIGIKPTNPNTGYGYIQCQSKDEELKLNTVMKVKTFTEKPNYDLAVSFLESGDFLWNAGIFIWSAKAILKAFEKHLPEINEIFNQGREKYFTTQEEDFIEKAYNFCPNISIDYGIMEKADNVYVIAADLGWSDLGTWGSLYENAPKNESGNAITCEEPVLFDTYNCVINLPKGKVAVIQGMNDYIVAEDNEVLLICKRDKEQHVRSFMDTVRAKKGEKFV